MPSFVQKSGTKLAFKAFVGDAKTLLAFNLPDKRDAKNLAGFTVQCKPDGQPAYFLQNTLRFETPGDHAQDQSQPPNASINAPFHKFRWIHIPGSVHQGISPFFGKYTYTATPRYFNDAGVLQPLDPDLSVSLSVQVVPFVKGNIELGFTRGFTQSQAFVNHFGLHAPIEPSGDELVFDTSTVAGTNAQGQQFTFEDEYGWLGFTARQKILDLLNDVLADKSKYLDVFAYDLNEPTIVSSFLQLAKQGRIRIILDNAALHNSATKPKPEDKFEDQFVKVAKSMSETDAPERSKQPTQILRGKFGRFAHDKILIVYQGDMPVKVLTGSTNYSITGLYVNSNHVIGYSDKKVAAMYAELFNTAWTGSAKLGDFVSSAISQETFSTSTTATPKTEITFAPHNEDFANQVLQSIADRIGKEGSKGAKIGSILFAVMAVDQGTGPVLDALKQVHKNQKIFSYGITDSTSGIYLYAPGKKTAVLVTGKPTKTILPPPFNQVRNIGGIGHQVHHKFVVCGFNGDNPVVYCGSSNLALGGETHNGDNLLAIYDPDVATAFAIEALTLVDHFDFLDRLSPAKATTTKSPAAQKSQAAANAQWFLSTNDRWTKPYFDSNDLHCVDRLLFA
ncbi:phospholipase D-like domain-containing protein [Paraburkholderia sp. RL17-337-BIB-A]|uniref:phospholipase D-like domain-containing protein n=1 Tax=Paraburkholderia sp. RL17-337-BIB-A TaxID=3031636 RepID=UPI0038BB2758